MLDLAWEFMGDLRVLEHRRAASVAVTGTECVALDRETSLGSCSEEACA